MLELLALRATLWWTFALTVVITAAFPFAWSFWDIAALDAISEPELVRQTIAEMSHEQRVAHAWITATLDVAYPLAYGTLFAGSAMAFLRRAGPTLARVVLLVIPTDLLEGVVQVLALIDVADLTAAKAVLTPLKVLLFLVGLVAMLWGWGIWLFRRVRGG